MAQIAGYAASTGQILNIGDVRAWLKEKHGEGDAEYAKTILCMPIINGQRTIIGKLSCEMWDVSVLQSAYVDEIRYMPPNLYLPLIHDTFKC